MLPVLSFRERCWPLIAVYFGAPICAEYLQAYLSVNALEMLGGLLIFGPLYGGAAVLIRELAVRLGLGWRGVLFLAAAFGIAMPGLIDLALFGEHRSDIPYWDALRLPTLVETLGFSAFASLGWVAGHVLMSVGAPLALMGGLAPRHRNRPLLGRVGIIVVSALWVIAVIMVHSDGRNIYGYAPSPVQVVWVSVVVLALVAMALSRYGNPVGAARASRRVRGWVILPIGLLGMTGFDLMPATWLGFAGGVAVLAAGTAIIAWFARTRSWSAYEIALLAGGAVVARILVGFRAPVPEGVTAASKYGSSGVLLLLAAALILVIIRRRYSSERVANSMAQTAP